MKQASKEPSTQTSHSPQSPSSSPSHEFSFTISLHSSATTSHDRNNLKTQPQFAIDLTPADDIFFHGHLLPLHLLSHFPESPRSSTNSLDSFTLPIKELMTPINNNNTEINRRPIKSKTFSFFTFKKWRKGRHESDKERDDEKREKKKSKKKVKFDVLKRYVRMVRPFLLFRGRREKIQIGSFSGNLGLRSSNSNSKQELIGRRGIFSAPASMRTSPGNSGLLVAKASIPCSTSDSTMEELQAAIQAAIAHCKNSISLDEKV